MDHFCQKYEINYIHPSTENLVLRGNGGSHSPHTEGKWTTPVRNVIFINHIQLSTGKHRTEGYQFHPPLEGKWIHST